MIFTPEVFSRKRKKKKANSVTAFTQLTFVDRQQSSDLNSADLNLWFLFALETLNRKKGRVKEKKRKK